MSFEELKYGLIGMGASGEGNLYNELLLSRTINKVFGSLGLFFHLNQVIIRINHSFQTINHFRPKEAL